MKSLRLAIGFFTIFPLARSGDMRDIAAAGFLLPVVGAALGALEGLAGWGLNQVFGPAVTAALVLALALILTGLHHADGLADVGDAVMAGGSRERRLAVLKDRTMGVGAVASLLLIYLITWTALAEAITALDASSLVWMMIAVEVSARLSLLLTAAGSRPSHSGTGSLFVEAMKGGKGIVAIAASVGILVALMVPIGWKIHVTSLIAASLVGVLLIPAGRRWFGGANGDLLGTAVEVGRMAALLGASLSAWVF